MNAFFTTSSAGQTSNSVAVAGGNGQNVDTSILRIETSFNTQGQIDKITSYSSATGGSAAIVNQIAREYNGLGQLTKEYQEHNGSLNSSLYVTPTTAAGSPP